ncbi:MAG TPA: DUF4384 domain-containing protein [Longimicrobiaceae bacterium]|nr:DUF4384 domain-containing protein [Longimicrobiaceae bacterium]
MHILLAFLALLATAGTAQAVPAPGAEPGSVSSPPPDRQEPRVRLWVENERDYFRAGERIRLQFRADRSAYVAVVHLTTDGEVEFLFPNAPWEDGFVHAGRTYALPYTSGYRYLTINGSPGIGYFFAIASDEPLDFRAFQDRYGRGWEFRRVVRGDPFYALDRIADILVDRAYGSYSTDYYGYHVGRRHPYPRYACYDGYADPYFWGGYYDRCDRLVVLLRSDPYYYDTRRYRGYRRSYLADRREQPLHRYKERGVADRNGVPPLRPSTGWDGGDRGSRSEEVSRSRPEPSERGDGFSRPEAREWQQPQQGSRGRGEERSRTEERSRPTLQRRPAEIETSRPRVTAPQREPQREPPPREQSRPEPREERTRPTEEARVRPPEPQS